MVFRRRVIALPVVVFLAVALSTAASLSAQPACMDRELLYRLDGNDFLWSELEGVSANDSLLAVLARSDPRIHLFSLADGALRQSWGRSGEGPGEFQLSTGVALLGDHLYAVDANQARVSVFELAGDLVRTIALRDHGISLRPTRTGRTESNALIFGLRQPMGDARTVASWSFGVGADAGSVQHRTIIAWERGTTIRLEGPPGFTLVPPFTPVPRWAAMADGVAWWEGTDAEVRILGVDGELVGAIPLTFEDRFEVTEEDREYWLQDEFPQELFGQRGVLDVVREEARQTVDFPSHHPLAYQLMGGPEGHLWVRRTPDGRDQIWDIVDSGGEVGGRVSLAPGEILMAVIPGHLVVQTIDELGVESVDVQRCGVTQG